MLALNHVSLSCPTRLFNLLFGERTSATEVEVYVQYMHVRLKSLGGIGAVG